MPNDNVYLNGMILPASEAKVSVYDAGLLHGASTFTTMLAHNGRIFRLGQHLDRLADTVDVLGLKVTTNRDELSDALNMLLRANELKRARCRITLTAGNVRDVEGPGTTLVTVDPLPEYPPEWYEKGISAVVSSFKQFYGDPEFGYKTGCYLPRILSRQEAAAKGAEEALWFNTDNYLAEGCFSNVFCVIDGKLFTPPRDTPVLPGVVRGVVLELAGQLGIAADADHRLTVQDMLSAEEMFTTSSCMGIRPVVRVERHQVGQGTPGELTKKITAAYRELLDRECPPTDTQPEDSAE